MGSQSVYATMKPNFAPLLKLIAIMTSDKEMIEKYPLSDLDKQIVRSPAIFKMMTDPGDGAGDIDFTGVLTAMCTGDEALSEQLAESYLKNLQRGMLSTKRAI